LKRSGGKVVGAVQQVEKSLPLYPSFQVIQALPSMSAINEIPTASAVIGAPAGAVASAPQEQVVDLEGLTAQLKSLDSADLFKVMKSALAEAEKKAKVSAKALKAPAAKKEKKAGSMPKGKAPPQLGENRAWVTFTLKHALENGWESFVVQNKKTKEEIVKPASQLLNGVHVKEGSVTAKTPNGVKLIQKDAMSLSKQRWTKRTQTGTHPELYEEFLASYDPEAVEEVEKPVKVPVVRKTEAEKKEEARAKKEEKERLANEKKVEKERLANEKKVEKERLANEKKTAPKKAKEETVATPVKKTAPVEVPAAPKKMPAKKVAAVVQEWSVPAGCAKKWEYKGKAYIRNSDNEVWLLKGEAGMGAWQGVYVPGDDRIDDSVEEPVYEDEVDEE